MKEEIYNEKVRRRVLFNWKIMAQAVTFVTACFLHLLLLDGKFCVKMKRIGNTSIN